MSVEQLAGALASLRDSLRRLAAEADNEGVAVRATQSRIRANLLLRRLGTGSDPSDPAAHALADRTLALSAVVSLVNPDDEPASHAVLEKVELTLGEVDAALGPSGPSLT
jgi:hypothetical protein